jgi:hypothetical protein
LWPGAGQAELTGDLGRAVGGVGDPRRAQALIDLEAAAGGGLLVGLGRGRMQIGVGGIETAKLKIECFFDLAEKKDEVRIKRLGKGQPITVRGEYDGQVSNVQLRECVLVE